MDYRISPDRNPYIYMLKNRTLINSYSVVPDKRGALLLSAQRYIAKPSAESSNIDKIHLSKGAENYLSGFRMELSEAMLAPMAPEMLGAPLPPTKFQEIFRVFSETAMAGKVTERLQLYYRTSYQDGELDPYLDNVDYFPEIVGAYEAEYKRLRTMRESGGIDEKQYKNSMDAVNSLFDDFVGQADMAAILNPAGIAHPLFAMRDAYNADYKQTFMNARAYIEQNGSLDGITNDILSNGTKTVNFSTIQEMFSDEGKLLLYDTAVLISEAEGRDAVERLLLKRSALVSADAEAEADELKKELEELEELEKLKQRLRETIEKTKASVTESQISETFKFILNTTLNWANINYFTGSDAKVSFLSYLKNG